MLRLEIVKISIKKSLLRVFSLLMIFIPLLLNLTSLSINDKIAGIWVVIWIVIFFLILNFQKRYKQYGHIYFNKSHIEIVKFENIKKIIHTDDLIINIYYKGYKGERIKYKYPIFFSFAPKEGIGEIEIINNKRRNIYNFLCKDKQIINSLFKIMEEYRMKGVNFNIHTE